MLYTDPTGRPFAKDPAVVRFHGRYYLYYSQRQGEDDPLEIAIAVSEDMEAWTKLGLMERSQPCERNGVGAPGAIVLDGRVHLFYQTYGNWEKDAICHAVSSDGVHFVKNPDNPVFAPDPAWCVGRAIDADVCVFGGRLLMYFATRDHAMRVQKLGGAWAPLDATFGRDAWQPMARQSLLTPEMRWEGECIEAPAAIVHGGRIYLFYGGSYNCTPQQIGCAASEDGVTFRRISDEPILPCGAPGAWNASESGHPYAFRDDDGRAYLFYQGSPDGGKSWYLSRKEIVFGDGDRVTVQ